MNQINSKADSIRKTKENFRVRSADYNNYGLTISEDHDHSGEVIRIEELVRGITETQKVLFSTGKNKDAKLKALKNYYFDEIKPYFVHDPKSIMEEDKIKSFQAEVIARSFPIHEFNPYVELFFRNVNERLVEKIDAALLSKYSDDELQEKIDLLNAFIESIRTEAASPSFQKTIKNYQRTQSKNYKSLIEYIDRLFAQYARLLVLRIDFSYKKSKYPLTKDEIYDKYSEVKKDRVHFFNNMRSNSLFGQMVGYAWKLEYGLEKGFHYHMLFFFDGSKVQQDINIARRLGEYWENTITGGRGLYYNCNAFKHGYLNQGIGMINHGDIELREGLKLAAAYLTKTDYYARIVSLEKNGRTFGKGEQKQVSKKRGRPRGVVEVGSMQNQ